MCDHDYTDGDCEYSYDDLREHVEEVEPVDHMDLYCACCSSTALMGAFCDGEVVDHYPNVEGVAPDIALCLGCLPIDERELLIEDAEWKRLEEADPVRGSAIAILETDLLGEVTVEYDDVYETDVTEGPRVVGKSVRVSEDGEARHAESGLVVADSAPFSDVANQEAKEHYREAQREAAMRPRERF
jgi:hypothetical protein